MKASLPIVGLAMYSLTCFSFTGKSNPSPSSPGFTENKGQVSDQLGKPRPDILFSGQTGGMAYHLSRQGISYQLCRVETWKNEKHENASIGKFPVHDQQVAGSTTLYRIDLEWEGINPDPQIKTDEALAGFTNYYLAVCPDGALNVKTYTGVTYKNIYNKIDLHYYHRDGFLEYDYLVAPYGDYKQIRIRIKGADGIVLKDDGTLVIKTPLGDIAEAAPVVFQDNKTLPAKWVLNKNELSFSIGNYNPSLPLIIDPLVKNWSTYYGGTGIDEARSCATDLNGDVYIAGRSNSSAAIATSGSHKTALSGTGYDAFLARFTTAGIRLWATYYGGAGDDNAYACVTDPSGDIYITGQVAAGSTTGIATAGTAHQGTHGGGTEAFLAKFNNSGVRLWGTYYGGPGSDTGEGLAVDASTSDIYMSGYCGTAAAGTIIATTGAHQTTYGSAILVKFNSSGVRLWGTYYGGSQFSHGSACTVDPSGNVYLAGNTDATSLIATPGAHQITQGGPMDDFLVKFNSAGVRQWGTYYGDISLETVGAVVTDQAGNVYIAGSAGSPNGIATPGAHQTVIGTAYNPDGIVAKFSTNGALQWGTYYGGTTEDYATSCVIAPNGDLYVAGYSNSTFTAAIATTDGLQTTCAGLGDAFLVRFTTAGVRVWATYYGEAANDWGYACAADANNNIYLAGSASTGPGNVFATPGCHQTVYGGGTNDAFLMQFKADCISPSIPVNVTPAANLKLCPGGTTAINATSSGTINWYSSATSTLSLGTGTVFTTPALTTGTVTYYAGATNSCSSAPSRTPVTVVVSKCTGLGEMNEDLSLKVFPNPVKETLFVQAEAPVEIKILNALGQLLLHEKSDNPNTRIDLSLYDSGIYLLEVLQEQKVKTFKVVKD